MGSGLTLGRRLAWSRGRRFLSRWRQGLRALHCHGHGRRKGEVLWVLFWAVVSALLAIVNAWVQTGVAEVLPSMLIFAGVEGTVLLADV